MNKLERKLTEERVRMMDDESQKTINLYHKNPDWNWEKLAYEVYREDYPKVVSREKREKIIKMTEVLETTYNYETAMKWYSEVKHHEGEGAYISFEYWVGDSRIRTRSTDLPVSASMKELYRAQKCEEVVRTEIYEDTVKEYLYEDEVPKKLIQRVKLCVGKHLINVCRAEEACPFKALLPEYELDIQEERVKV